MFCCHSASHSSLLMGCSRSSFLKGLGHGSLPGIGLLFSIVLNHMCACSVLSDSVQSHGLRYLARLHCPWHYSGKNMGVGCHFLLQGMFPAQRQNLRLLCFLHWQVDSLPLSHLGSPALITVHSNIK